MDDDKRPETNAVKRPTDPTTELYKRVIERASEPERARPRRKRQPRSDGEAIAELGDEVGGPA
jgi:hypothetical protein